MSDDANYKRINDYIADLECREQLEQRVAEQDTLSYVKYNLLHSIALAMRVVGFFSATPNSTVENQRNSQALNQTNNVIFKK